VILWHLKFLATKTKKHQITPNQLLNNTD